MGNFSFGDYFKEKAIPYAWELVTEGWAWTRDRLWVTVHDSDDEAEEIWADAVGVPRERIQRLGDKDNFWQMGETGRAARARRSSTTTGRTWAADGGPQGRLRGAVRRDLEPGLHAVRPGRRRHPDAAAQAQHRHRRRARAGRGGAAGRLLRLGHRPAPRPHRDGQLGHRQGPRPRRAHRGEPAHPGRARPVVGHARERRRVPLERGSRLRAAPHHPPRGAPRLPARHRAARAPQAGVRGHRRDDAGLPRAGDATATSSRASSRARRSASARRCATAWASSTTSWPRSTRARRCRGPRPSSCTTPTASRSSSPPRSPPSAGSTSTGPASRPRWPSSGAGPRTPARLDRARVSSSTPTGRSSRSSASPSSPATTTTRPRAACWRCSRSRTTSSRCSPTARRSTPRPAVRWATPG